MATPEITREDIAGVSSVITSEQVSKDVASTVGQGNVRYSDHSAPAIDTNLAVLGWSGMKVVERQKSIQAETWESRVTVRDAIMDKLEEPILYQTIYISAGFNRGLGDIVPENQKDQIVIKEKGGEEDEDEAWTAILIANDAASDLGLTLSINCLDYTVSKIEFGADETILGIISSLFGMYNPRVFVADDTLYVLDRIAGSIGQNAVVNANALAIDQREQREPMPRSIRVVGASTSSSNTLKEKSTRSFREAIGDYTFTWKGYGSQTLTEVHETELVKTEIERKYGTDVDGNRQYLVREDTVIWKRKDGKESGSWEMDSEESSFHMHSRTSNLWEAPRVEFTVSVTSMKIWQKTGGSGVGSPHAKKALNEQYGWTFSYKDFCAYVFHRYVWGDTPFVRLTDSDGDPVAMATSLQQANQGSSAAMMQHGMPNPPGFGIWPQPDNPAFPINPEAPPFFMGPGDGVRSGTGGRSTGGSGRSGSSSSTTGGDLLVAELVTHKAILICKSGMPAAPDGTLCWVPAIKIDRLSVFNARTKYDDGGESNEGGTGGGDRSNTQNTTSKENAAAAAAQAVSAAAQAATAAVAAAVSSLTGSAMDHASQNVHQQTGPGGPDEPHYGGPGDAAPPGGFSDDYFNQFRTAKGTGPPVWGSEIIRYTPLTKDTHLEQFFSVFYDESIDIMREKNNVNIEWSSKVVGSPNPRAPLRKSRVQSSWSSSVESEVDGVGTGPALVVSNPAIATQEDADAIAQRLADIYAHGHRQFTTVIITADLTPEVGWGVSGTVTHPNGPALVIGANGFLTAFSKSREGAGATRTVQLTVEADA